MADATGKNAHATLDPHRKQKVRAFLRKFDDDRAPEAGAFWTVLFGGLLVSHEIALKVGRELETTERTVGDLLEGWRPDALADPRTEASRYALPTKATP